MNKEKLKHKIEMELPIAIVDKVYDKDEPKEWEVRVSINELADFIKEIVEPLEERCFNLMDRIERLEDDL